MSDSVRPEVTPADLNPGELLLTVSFEVFDNRTEIPQTERRTESVGMFRGVFQKNTVARKFVESILILISGTYDHLETMRKKKEGGAIFGGNGRL